MKTLHRPYGMRLPKPQMSVSECVDASFRKKSIFVNIRGKAKLIHDIPPEHRGILERYYSDLNKVFEERFAALGNNLETFQKEKAEVKGLLEELLEVRAMLGEKLD